MPTMKRLCYKRYPIEEGFKFSAKTTLSSHSQDLAVPKFVDVPL